MDSESSAHRLLEFYSEKGVPKVCALPRDSVALLHRARVSFLLYPLWCAWGGAWKLENRQPVSAEDNLYVLRSPTKKGGVEEFREQKCRSYTPCCSLATSVCNVGLQGLPSRHCAGHQVVSLSEWHSPASWLKPNTELGTCNRTAGSFVE